MIWTQARGIVSMIGMMFITSGAGLEFFNFNSKLSDGFLAATFFQGYDDSWDIFVHTSSYAVASEWSLLSPRKFTY